MGRDTADVVRMRLERLHFVHRVVIVHTHKHVVRTRHDPLLAGDEFGRPDCKGGRFVIRIPASRQASSPSPPMFNLKSNDCSLRRHVPGFMDCSCLTW